MKPEIAVLFIASALSVLGLSIDLPAVCAPEMNRAQKANSDESRLDVLVREFSAQTNDYQKLVASDGAAEKNRLAVSLSLHKLKILAKAIDSEMKRFDAHYSPDDLRAHGLTGLNLFLFTLFFKDPSLNEFLMNPPREEPWVEKLAF